MNLRETLRSFDWVLTVAAMLLVAIGITAVFSTTSDKTLFSAQLLRQAFALVVSLVVFIVLSLFPYHKLKRYAVWLLLWGLVILIVTSHTSLIIRGTTSRFEIFGLQIQPSEFMKIAVIIFISWLFTKYKLNWRTILVSLAAAGTTTALIALEPDLGVAALIITVWCGFIVFIGIPWRFVVLGAGLGVLGFFTAWHWVFAVYQKTRIITFLNPAGDPLGAGYNIMQSIIALGSGGLWGRGLGHGPQSQLKFLPEQHTDFIIASIGEELGFIGIALIIILYAVLLWRIIRIAANTRDTFGQYISIAVFLLLLSSFFISTGMNMGLLPVTGIPLPLVSYGGSSLVSTFILLGIIQSIHIHSKWVRRPPAELVHF